LEERLRVTDAEISEGLTKELQTFSAFHMPDKATTVNWVNVTTRGIVFRLQHFPQAMPLFADKKIEWFLLINSCFHQNA
jgi:hypothetical protein